MEHRCNDSNGQLKYSERNLACCSVCAINPTWNGLGLKLGVHGEMVTTHGLQHKASMKFSKFSLSSGECVSYFLLGAMASTSRNAPLVVEFRVDI
jgi:hypothetical protein